MTPTCFAALLCKGGLVDLLNAVTRGSMFTPDGHLGAAFWIPASIVPTHLYMFYLLLQEMRINRAVPA